MAKAPNIADILDRPSADAEPPKPIPPGTYIAQVQGLPREGTSPRTQTPFVEFTLMPIEVYRDKDGRSDIDEDALEEMGGLNNRTLRDTYYLTDDAEFRLRQFFDNCGIPDMNGKHKLTHRERIVQTPGCQVGISVKHSSNRDNTAIFANVSGTFKV